MNDTERHKQIMGYVIDAMAPFIEITDEHYEAASDTADAIMPLLDEARLDEWRRIDRNYFTNNTRLFTYADFRLGELTPRKEN